VEESVSKFLASDVRTEVALDLSPGSSKPELIRAHEAMLNNGGTAEDNLSLGRFT
jgi:hypothetical protein